MEGEEKLEKTGVKIGLIKEIFRGKVGYFEKK